MIAPFADRVVAIRLVVISKNVFVIKFAARSRRIAANKDNARTLLSTLIEACASNRRGLAIS
jgi:hypothetical protein